MSAKTVYHVSFKRKLIKLYFLFFLNRYFKGTIFQTIQKRNLCNLSNRLRAKSLYYIKLLRAKMVIYMKSKYLLKKSQN